MPVLEPWPEAVLNIGKRSALDSETRKPVSGFRGFFRRFFFTIFLPSFYELLVFRGRRAFNPFDLSLCEHDVTCAVNLNIHTIHRLIDHNAFDKIAGLEKDTICQEKSRY